VRCVQPEAGDSDPARIRLRILQEVPLSDFAACSRAPPGGVLATGPVPLWATTAIYLVTKLLTRVIARALASPKVDLNAYQSKVVFDQCLCGLR
jgi:hypothetical protein